MSDARNIGLSDQVARRVRYRVPKRLPPGERVYAVGDIHGRADLLAEMQEIIAADAARRPSPSVTVVFLGDYIDRGPASRQVIDMLIGFAEARPHSIFLMGNHEEAMLRFLADPLDGHQWRGFGGLETLISYGVEIGEMRFGRGFGEARNALLAAMPEPHRDFFLSLKFCDRIGDYFFCHAGVRPGVALEAQDPHDLIWIREEFLYWGQDFGMTIVHGHTPVAQPELRANRVNVDTGAYATGRLTCAVIEGSEIGFLSTPPRL
ncbi:serine/threonine protein phosphatase 1 [Rhizobiales bacterium GAS188]|nr:serine/threonine protein phosphatase 1 [Rhizobiales bacterium GAS188]